MYITAAFTTTLRDTISTLRKCAIKILTKADITVFRNYITFIICVDKEQRHNVNLVCEFGVNEAATTTSVHEIRVTVDLEELYMVLNKQQQTSQVLPIKLDGSTLYFGKVSLPTSSSSSSPPTPTKFRKPMSINVVKSEDVATFVKKDPTHFILDPNLTYITLRNFPFILPVIDTISLNKSCGGGSGPLYCSVRRTDLFNLCLRVGKRHDFTPLSNGDGICDGVSLKTVIDENGWLEVVINSS